MEDLNDRRIQILECVSKSEKESGRSPTVREIMADVGIASTYTVVCNLNRLAEKGWLTRDARTSRSIRLTERAKTFLGAPRYRKEVADYRRRLLREKFRTLEAGIREKAPDLIGLSAQVANLLEMTNG